MPNKKTKKVKKVKISNKNKQVVVIHNHIAPSRTKSRRRKPAPPIIPEIQYTNHAMMNHNQESEALSRRNIAKIIETELMSREKKIERVESPKKKEEEITKKLDSTTTGRKPLNDFFTPRDVDIIAN